ncbi:MAG: RDD family protein [Cellvibrio sp.]|jgi:Predicted membrane protein/domain
MENPYQSPSADLMSTPLENEQAMPLASKWARFFGAIIDGIIGILIALPFWFLIGGFEMFLGESEPPFKYTLLGAVYGFVAFLLVHGYLLKHYGQTVGKKLMGTRITDMQGNLPEFAPLVLKRYLPISVVSIIPLLGPLLSLIDVLFIFRSDRRCVHDLIAGTQVLEEKK